MNKIVLALCMFVISCNASEKVTLVSAYSTMSSKRQRHEILLSNGTFIMLQTSLVDTSNIKVTVSQKAVPIPFEERSEEEEKYSVLEKRRRSRSQSRPTSPLARCGELRSKSMK